MRQVLATAGDRFGDQPFLIFPERTFTHRALVEPVSAVAAALADRYGVGPGDRVAVVAANCPGHALASWAAVCLGATVVELNGWWTGPEMLHGLDLTKPKVLLGDRRRLERLAEAPVNIPVQSVSVSASVGLPVVCFEDELDALEKEERRAARYLPTQIDEDDPLVILFTSGTTESFQRRPCYPTGPTST